jgi:hypothetical protein
MDETLQQEINRIAAEYLEQLKREGEIEILHGLAQFEDHFICTQGKATGRL